MKKEILKGFIQKVWNEGNISAIPDYIADKYTVIHDPGDPWDGMDLDVAGFQNRVLISRAPVPDQRFEIQDLYENKDSVCMTWLWSGTHLGEISVFRHLVENFICPELPHITFKTIELQVIGK